MLFGDDLFGKFFEVQIPEKETKEKKKPNQDITDLPMKESKKKNTQKQTNKLLVLHTWPSNLEGGDELTHYKNLEGPAFQGTKAFCAQRSVI